MWTCKQCNSKVEDNFDICWNCNADKNGSFSTYENIQNEIKTSNQRIELITEKKKNSMGDFNTIINPNDIVTAGKALRRIGDGVIALFVCTIIGLIIIFGQSNIDTDSMKYAYFGLGFVDFIIGLYILVKIYDAGIFLEKSVKSKRT